MVSSAVFIGVMIEQIIVPIPSPMIIMGAGAILILPDLSIPNAFLQILWIIVLPGTIASTLGSFIGYTISYYGGKALVVRFQRFLGVDWEEIENLEKRFQGKKGSPVHLSFQGHPGLSHLSGLYFCRTSSHSSQTLYPLYVSGFHLPMFLSGLCRMVDRIHL